MLKNTSNRLRVVWLGVSLMSLIAIGLGGGFFLSVTVPEEPSDDSVLLISPHGCGRPQEAKFSGSAEGLVDGRRLSVPLDLKMDSSGAYRIRRQWPRQGSWVLAVTATYQGLTRSALVELGPDGFARTPAKTSLRKLSNGEINAALQAVSDRLSP